MIIMGKNSMTNVMIHKRVNDVNVYSPTREGSNNTSIQKKNIATKEEQRIEAKER